MARKPKVAKQSTPKGYEIPVPSKREFLGNLDKLMKAPAPKKGSGRTKT